MLINPFPAFEDHIEDIFNAAIDHNNHGKAFALIFVKATDGGSVRRPGAAMLVNEDGDSMGYISGGCIDADACAQAMSAIAENKNCQLRYGQGSPYLDLKLPCGNGIDVLILSSPDISVIHSALSSLHAREPITLYMSETEGLDLRPTSDSVKFTVTPKLRLRIAGRGHDAIALTRIATAAGLSVTLQCPDIEDLDTVPSNTIGQHLSSLTHIPVCEDDAFTAFALMFHDVDWEGALLQQALQGPAFFIGAVGSHKTHSKRSDMLLRLGISNAEIERINAPIGLINSMRDSSMLAISILAAIIEAFHEAHL